MPRYIITFDEGLHLPSGIKEFASEDEAQMWAASVCMDDGMLDDQLADAYLVEPYSPELATIYGFEG